jgi:hypothetical protein
LPIETKKLPVKPGWQALLMAFHAKIECIKLPRVQRTTSFQQQSEFLSPHRLCDTMTRFIISLRRQAVPVCGGFWFPSST